MDFFKNGAVLADSANPLEQVAEPVIQILNWTVWPILSILGAVGIIYGIVIGVRMAKADSAQEREEAKKKLITACIGVALIFVIMVVFPILMSALGEWARQQNPDLEIPSSSAGIANGWIDTLSHFFSL